MGFKYKIVRRLLRDDEVSFSRNKNFEAYEDPRVKRAVRIYRHLESVEKEILQCDPSAEIEIDIVERQDQEMVQFVFARKGGRRMSFVEPPEWPLLREHERIEDVLDGIVKRATDEVREKLEAYEEKFGEENEDE